MLSSAASGAPLPPTISRIDRKLCTNYYMLLPVVEERNALLELMKKDSDSLNSQQPKNHFNSIESNIIPESARTIRQVIRPSASKFMMIVRQGAKNTYFIELPLHPAYNQQHKCYCYHRFANYYIRDQVREPHLKAEWQSLR